jgi:hypothetical protein
MSRHRVEGERARLMELERMRWMLRLERDEVGFGLSRFLQ